MHAKRFGSSLGAASLAALLGTGALVLTGCASGPAAPASSVSAVSPSSSSGADPVTVARPDQRVVPVSPPAGDPGAFTFDGIDGIRLGMSAEAFAAAFPDARFWPLSADDPGFGPGETLADRLRSGGAAGLEERACPIVGTPLQSWTEVQLENGVVVAIVKRSSGGQLDQGVEFRTDAGRTAESTLGDLQAEFGDVLVVQDDGWERWIMKGPDGRTMQIGGIDPSSGVPSMAGVMDANHSMRLVPKDWSACRSVVNGVPETA